VLFAPFAASAQDLDRCKLPAFLQAVVPDNDSLPRALDRPVRTALDQAVDALNDKRYAEARAAVGQLERDVMTPYELGMAEAVLFRIADAELKYDDARRHLVNAIESCGLTSGGIADAQDAIRRIDERLGAAPSP
jgi:hypothetical protein